MAVKINIDEEAVEEIFLNVLFKSVLKMDALAVEHAPSGATDELRQKIDFFPKQYGSTDYKVISQAQHSAAIEFGTKPHAVSPNKLKDWARLKLGDEKAAYAVAQKIKKEGTDAHPYMYPAFLEVKEIWVPRFFKEEIDKRR